MTDWDRVQLEFSTLCDLGDEERNRRLRELDQEDPALASEIASLLDHSQRAGTGFLESSICPPPATSEAPPMLAKGQRLGSYILDEKIAEGGMGEVFAAHRADGLYELDVAVKVLRADIASDETKERFRLERETLAQLQHPAIAKIFEAGSMPDGRPYLVMELIDGKPINAYCRGHRLSIDDRLRLFGDVCDAVAFAHDRLVVHRDLKPSNILVTDEGHAKLVDFGIAKLLDDSGKEDAGNTRLPALTPNYASPEQIRGEGITVASDVYSLGIVLYELLTDEHPYDTNGDWLDAKRAVCEFDPPLPSRRQPRGGTSSLASQIRGDLDTIVSVAIRKDPARRYASVRELTADVRRYLEGRAVLAQGDSTWYLMSCFLRRHRLAASLAALLVVSGALGIAGVVRQAEIAQREEARALDAERKAAAERDRAQTLSRFWEGLITSARPGEYGPDLPLRVVLDDAARTAHVGLEDEPEREASLRHTIGKTYLALGLFRAAKDNLQRALDLVRKEHVTPDDIARVEIELALARALCELKENESSNALLDEVMVKIEERTDRVDQRVQALEVLGSNAHQLDRPDDARRYMKQALALAETTDAPDPVHIASMLATLAAIEFKGGRLDRGLAMVQDAMHRFEDQGEADSPEALRVHANLAALLQAAERFDEAEKQYETTLALADSLLGDDHPDTGTILHNFAFMEDSRMRIVEAASLAERALEIRERTLGIRDERTLSSRVLLAVCLKKQGRLHDARDLLQQARLYSDDVPWDLTGAIEAHLASIERQIGSDD